MSNPQETVVNCYMCGDKNPANFYKDKSRGNGFSSRCKKCSREYTRPLKRIKPTSFTPLAPDAPLKCPNCSEVKPASDFYENQWRRTGRASNCKACFQSRYFSQKDRIRFQRIAKNFGITEEQYIQMLADQKGVCAICKKPETSVRFKHLSVDHCHKTGKIRGLLCHHCNKALGNFFDNIQNLKSAISYLEIHE